jgi:hypothetical protein
MTSSSGSSGQQLLRGGGPFVQTAPQYVQGPNNTYINIGCQLISLSGVRPGAPVSGEGEVYGQGACERGWREGEGAEKEVWCGTVVGAP